MKAKSERKRLETGQVIPLVVLMLFAIIAMVALILDGGALLSNRRTAQAAADSGALAGAKILCNNNAAAETVTNTAIAYALKNKANEATANINSSLVVVNTNVTNDSFFAGIFGVDNLVSTAAAAAGCYSIDKAKVLPIAWSCRAPINGSDSEDCEIQMLNWKNEFEPLLTGNPSQVNIHNYGTVSTPMDLKKQMISKYIYVIMDSNKLESDLIWTCADPTIPYDPASGLIDCDIDNDGTNDVFGHGDRSWLDLDGGLEGPADTDDSNGAKALKNWINGIGVPTLAIHTWLGGQTGVATSIFQTVSKLSNPLVVIPVFNAICDSLPGDNPACYATAHAGLDPEPQDNPVKVSPGATSYFHIVGFSAFYITCVDDGGGANKCPGAKAFIAGLNIDKNNPPKLKTIEGYFIEGYPFEVGSPGTGGVDAGIHIISLSEVPEQTTP